MKKSKNKTDIGKYKDSKKSVQKAERQSYWAYINDIIETGDLENDHQPLKQKRFWHYIKSLWKDSTGIAPLNDNGCLFNASKDKADILNRQYQSVFMQEDPGSPIPHPDGDPFPDSKDIKCTVSEEGVRKPLLKSNPRKTSGPDMISARFLKECSEEHTGDHL